MGFDQKGNVVLRCSRDNDGRWHVMENEFEKPLASFDSKQDAIKYAHELADKNEGTRVQDDDMPNPTTH